MYLVFFPPGSMICVPFFCLFSATDTADSHSFAHGAGERILVVVGVLCVCLSPTIGLGRCKYLGGCLFLGSEIRLLNKRAWEPWRGGREIQEYEATAVSGVCKLYVPR